MTFHGRLKPYTERGIVRVPCIHCKRPSVHQWQICANGNRYVGLCLSCDIELNEMCLNFMTIDNREELLENYINETRRV